MSCIWFIFNLCLLVSFGHVNWSCICFHSNLAVYCLDESSLTYKVRRGLNWYLVPKYALLTRNIFSRHAVAYFMIFSFVCEMLFLQLYLLETWEDLFFISIKVFILTLLVFCFKIKCWKDLQQLSSIILSAIVSSFLSSHFD